MRPIGLRFTFIRTRWTSAPGLEAAKYGGAFQGCQFDGRELRNTSVPPPASLGLAAIVISSRRWPFGSPGNDGVDPETWQGRARSRRPCGANLAFGGGQVNF
jgi:hypothetical protein